MSTNQANATSSASGRVGRSQSTQDRRRGRSRSPSAYLRKTGKGLTGLLFGTSSRKNALKRSSPAVLSSQKTSASTPSPARPASTSSMERTLVADTSSKAEGEDEASFPKLIATTIGFSPQTSYDEDESSTVYNVVMDDFSQSQPEDASAESSKVHKIESADAPLEPQGTAESITSELPEPSSGSVAVLNAKETETKPKQQHKAENLQVILLLMAFDSRRFELLQLEFDPNKALVGDILAQVSASATEEELRSQKYIGICSADGTELPTELLLKNVVKTENEVMLAVPEGSTAFSCTKLSMPILHDPKVRSMLGNSPLLESPSQKKKLSAVMQPIVEGANPEFLRAIEDANAVKSSDVSNVPISPQVVTDRNENQILSVEEGPHTSGRQIDVVATTQDPVSLPNVRDVNKTALASTKTPKKSNLKAQDEHFSSEEIPHSNNTKVAEILVGTVDPVTHKIPDKQGASLAKVVLMLLLTVSVIPITFLQLTITSPLGPGDRLAAGQFRRKCGITSVTKEPFNGCNELSAEFDENGVLTVYKMGSMLSDNKTVLYRLMSIEKSSIGDGLHVGYDGSLSIGGKPVVVEVPPKSDPVLNPWPFAKTVNLQKPKRKGSNTVWRVAPL